MSQGIFSPQTVQFLVELRENNNREWFSEHKSEYEDLVREPALAFISAMSPVLEKVSTHFDAVPKKVGGSLMRVYRDTRFGKDKTPYKTNIGIQFRHEIGKDVHAPGFYVHIDPEEVFVGVGLWRPDGEALKSIRQKIDEEPKHWQDIAHHGKFAKHFEMVGDSLKRPPKGYDAEHPLLVDLKRKDFIALHRLTHDDLYQDNLVKKVGAAFSNGSAFMAFLCQAVGLEF